MPSISDVPKSRDRWQTEHLIETTLVNAIQITLAAVAVIGGWMGVVWTINYTNPDLTGSWLPGVAAAVAIVLAGGAVSGFGSWICRRWPHYGGADGVAENVAVGIFVTGLIAAAVFGACCVAIAITMATDLGIGALYTTVPNDPDQCFLPILSAGMFVFILYSYLCQDAARGFF